MYVGTRNCCLPVCPPGSSSTVAPVTRSGVFTVAANPPSDVTMPITLTPLGSGGFWAWASAGRLARPRTTKLAAAAMETLVIIGAPPRNRVSCSLPVQAITLGPPACAPARQQRGTSPGYAEASRGFSRLSRLTCHTRIAVRCAWLVLAGLGWLLPASLGPAAGADVSEGFQVGVVVPFATEPRKTVFGSLAVDPLNGDIFLGEENGNRIYRLGADRHLQVAALGLNHLLGGSAIALDQKRRLVFLDYASPEMHLRSESPLPPSLIWLTEEGYRGPEVFRVDVQTGQPLPRRADLLPPILPRSWTTGAGQEPMWRLIAVTASGDDLVLLSAVGEVFRLGPDGELRHVARLPAGHYHRTNMAIGPDGSVFVCGGFHLRQIFRISLTGEVSIVASELGDPGGIVLDREGALYVAETALHRIIRISPAGRR